MVYAGQWLRSEATSANMTDVNMWLRRCFGPTGEGRTPNSLALVSSSSHVHLRVIRLKAVQVRRSIALVGEPPLTAANALNRFTRSKRKRR